MCPFVIYNSEIGLITLWSSLCISGNSDDPGRQAETERGPQEGKCRETEEVMVVQQQQQQQHACGGDIGLFERTNEAARGFKSAAASDGVIVS